MRITLSLLVALAGSLSAQTAVTEPIGFNKITCLTNSDTIVGVPFRFQGSQSTTLVSAPVVEGDVATLTLSLNSLTAGAYVTSKHYVKFNTGTKDGRFYDITTNTANTLTIDLNGDNLTGVLSGNPVVIAQYWTLNSLFPPAGVTSSWTETPASSGNWVPNGHAIVGSSGTSLRVRRTEIYLPDLISTGINLASAKIYYINTATSSWVETLGQSNPGNTILYPDTYFVVRNPPSVTRATTFKAIGEVEMNTFSIALRTSATTAQDCPVSIPRPVAVRLDALGLLDTSSLAFVASSGTSLRNRKDQLLVFDNGTALINRSPSKIYYHNSTGGNWIDSAGDIIANDALIPAGSGFLIRKAKGTGFTSFWKNQPNYTP